MNEIFGGKIPGLRAPIKLTDTHLDETEDKIVQNVKQGMGWTGDDTGFFGREIPGNDFTIDNNKTFEGETKIKNLFKNKKIMGMKKMPSFNMKSKLNMGNLKQLKSNKANLLMARSPKNKSMASKVKEYGFGSSSKKNNYNNIVNSYMPQTFGHTEKNARNNLFNVLGSKTEKGAWGRLKKQQFLSPTGDFDGDKLMNMLDCDPRDPNAQGVINKLGNWATGKGFRETSDVLKTPVGNLQTYSEPQPPGVKLYNALDQGKKETVVPQIQIPQAIERLATVPSAVFGLGRRGAGVVGSAIADKYRTHQQQKAEINVAKQAGRVAGLEYLQEEKLKQMALQQFNKAAKVKQYKGKSPEEQYDKFWRKQYEREVLGKNKRSGIIGHTDRLGQIAGLPGQILGQTTQTMRFGFGAAFPGRATYDTARLMGVGGSPFSVLTAVGAQRGPPLDVKVDSWFGSGEKLKEWASTEQTRPQQVQIPQPQQVQVQPQQPTYQQPQQRREDESGMVYSQKSGRPVRYLRKPYTKYRK